MGSDSFVRGMNISASGLEAEWRRMQMISANIANADVAETPEGGPYRRQQIEFLTTLGQLEGVRVGRVVDSQESPRMQFNPHHPAADEEGYVALPSIRTPLEMADMMTAARAYQANTNAMKSYKMIAAQIIDLLK